jgi:hypothetical protein
MSIERFQRTLALTPTDARTGAPQQAEALAAALGEFTRVATQIGMQVQSQRGAEAGAQAGNQVDAPNRRTGVGIFAQRFNEAAQKAHGAAIDTDIRLTMDRLATEYETDSAGFDAAFQGYQRGMLDSIDVRVRPQVEQELALQQARHRAPIIKREQDILLEQNMATLVDSAEGIRLDALQSARDGDVEFTEHQRGKFLDIITTAERTEDNPTGILSPGDVQQMRKDFERSIDAELVVGDFERILRDMGLDAAQQAFDSFERLPQRLMGDISPQERDQLLGRMGALMSRDMARAARDAAAENAKRSAMDKAARDQINGAIKVLEAGFVPDGLEDTLRLAEGTELEGPARIAVTLAGQAAQFSAMAPTTRAQALERMEADMRGRPIDPVELQRLRSFDTIHDNLQRDLDRDPMGLGIRQGIIEPPAPLDLSSAEGLAETLAERVGPARALESHYQQRNTPPLTAAEADQMSELWAGSSAETRVALLAGISQGLGERAADALQQIHQSGGDLMAWTGGMVMEGNDRAARQVLLGLEELAADPRLAPNDIDARPELADVRRAYGPATGASVIDAITAHYAHESRLASDHSADFNPRRLRNSIDAVTGGGILEVNFRNFGPKSVTPAPAPGVTARDMKRWYNGLEPSAIDELGGVAGLSSTRALEMIRQNGRLTSVGRGEWMVSVSSPADDGRQRFLMGDNGEPFILRWDAGRPRMPEAPDAVP